MRLQGQKHISRLALLGLGLSAIVLFGASCHLYNLERQLKPPDAEFLNQVRYIISGEERKTFLELPDSEKSKFIEDFWKRRDPDPDSEENEFKTEYFKRIQKSNELFHGEGKPGWLTDRGRIYILFGPPMDRIINPPSLSGKETCSEIWYYGQFPVVFNDPSCSGNYELVTYDLTAMREQNLAYMASLNKAQDEAQKTVQPNLRGGPFMDYEWDVQKTVVTPDRIEGQVIIDVPISRIWFTAVQDKLETVLQIAAAVKDSTGKVYWERKETVTVTTSEAKLKTQSKEKVRTAIPFQFDRDLDRLRAGKNLFTIEVKNDTGNETVKKSQAFTL